MAWRHKARKGHYPLPTSTAKSLLQKQIRRGLTKGALITAVHLIETDFVQFIRRLPIIVIEDTILHPELDKLTDILIRGSRKDYDNPEEDLTLLLKIVRDISDVKVRDSNASARRGASKSIQQSSLSDKANALIRSMKIRAAYGGTWDDKGMLWKYADLWADRFLTNEDYWFKKFDEIYPEREQVDISKIGVIEKSDIISEAIDFHCSSIIDDLADNKEVIRQIDLIFKDLDKDPKNILRELIWHFRSKLNNRPFIWQPEKLCDEFTSELSFYKYLELFGKINHLIDKRAIKIIDGFKDAVNGSQFDIKLKDE